MRLKNITIAGFRCFGPQPVRFRLSNNLTAVVGANASGKTALLHALSKLFGVSRSQRALHRSDFHLPSETDPEDRSSREVAIDALLEFPEIPAGKATPETIAPVFKHMLIPQAGDTPVCRIRLEARWDDDRTVEGEVTQDLYWVTTLDAPPPEEKKHRMLASDRGLIQLIYMPANRDAGAQIRAKTGALAARLLRAIEWSEHTQYAIEEATEALSDAFEEEAAIKAIDSALDTRWSGLHDEEVDKNPKLSLVSRRFDEVISRIGVTFQDGPESLERGLEALSDGQQSLFYFALSAATYDLERSVVAGKIEGFRPHELRIPSLTIFALEEPENHLSPYYLARILEQVRSVVKRRGAQAIITSHSPAVLGRVAPGEVRHCRRDSQTRTSSVKSVHLPKGEMEATKFVRGAMQAFPELYFARFVVLVEGDSERIVLPRIARMLELLIDPSFVALVPLGGRHVVYFWELLGQLNIPYATLIDLDIGRIGGGFGRIKEIIQHLLRAGVRIAHDDGTILSDDDLQGMHDWQDPEKLDILMEWVTRLRTYGVFFSSPLDFDLMMLSAFPEAYRALESPHGGPRLDVSAAAEVVLGRSGPGLELYKSGFEAFATYLPSYRYHFFARSKPATHMAAITRMEDAEIIGNMPEPIRALLQHVSDGIVHE